MSYATAWQVAGEAVAEQAEVVRGFFDQSTAAARELLGLNQALTGETNTEGTAVERLNRLIDEQLKKREAEAAAVKEEASQTAGLKVQVGELQRLRALEIETKNRLLAIERLRAQVENDFSLTEAEKFAAKRIALEEERRILSDIVAQLRERAALSQLTEQEREQTLGRADTFERQLSGTEGQLAGMGPDPASMEQQMTAAITNLQNQFGTVAQSIARGFTTVIGKAVDGVASSIQGLIQGTMNWADALRNVGTTILSAVINAIAKMVAEWIVGRALIAAKEVLFSAQETAAKAPNALMTSITSYGAAAIVGLAAFAAAMAAMGAFAEGGFTGAGSRMEPAGLVHRGEFVVPADRVAEFGVGFFKNIRQGTVGPDDVAPPAAGEESSGRPITIILVDSRQEAKRWAESVEGQATIVNVVRNNRTEIGIPS
jgi:hypothetical protein